jgi:hypothetical protein
VFNISLRNSHERRKDMEGLRKQYKGLVMVFCFFLLSWVVVSLTQTPEIAHGGSESSVELGKKVYDKYCVI